MTNGIKRPKLQRGSKADGLSVIDTSEVELTPREARFFKAITEGKSNVEAAEIAGYSTLNAAQSAYNAMRNIKRKVSDTMDSKGLSVEALIDSYLKPMLSATEVKVFKAGGTTFKNSDGVIEEIPDSLVYSDPLIAWSPRKDALDMSLKIHGAYARPENADSGANITNNSLTIVNHIERPKRERANAASVN